MVDGGLTIDLKLIRIYFEKLDLINKRSTMKILGLFNNG